MICQKCNFQNEEAAKFCKNCGIELTNVNVDKSKKAMRNGFGITGFVISLISACAFGASLDKVAVAEGDAPPLIAVIGFAVLGLVFSYIGFSQKNKTKWQAITGLSISGTVLFITIIGLCFNLL